jgi:hypothetical protein
MSAEKSLRIVSKPLRLSRFVASPDKQKTCDLRLLCSWTLVDTTPTLRRHWSVCCTVHTARAKAAGERTLRKLLAVPFPRLIRGTGASSMPSRGCCTRSENRCTPAPCTRGSRPSWASRFGGRQSRRRSPGTSQARNPDSSGWREDATAPSLHAHKDEPSGNGRDARFDAIGAASRASADCRSSSRSCTTGEPREHRILRPDLRRTRP